MINKPLACQQHDHKLCIDAALTAAQTLCSDAGVRLTDQRKKVLELIWQSHKPLGAYTLMHMLEQSAAKKIAPPTVYRALDFLLEQQLIHRINSLNAYIGCPTPGTQHASHFLICHKCGIAVETNIQKITDDLVAVATQAGFSCESLSVEIAGYCADCQQQQQFQNQDSAS